MEILLILLLLAAPSVPSLAPLLSALAAIPQAAQGSQCPAPQAQNAAMQPPQNSALPSPQSEEGRLLASLLQLFRPQEEQGEGGAPQDAPGLFALLQLFSAPREQGEKNAPQEAALAALLRQLTENAESTQGNACAKRPQGAAEQAVQAYKNDAEGTELSADAPFAPDRGGHAEDTFSEPAESSFGEPAEDPLAPIRAIAPAAALRRLAGALQGKG